MSHWNYRFVAVDIDGETEIGLYEVYYDDDGKPNGRTKELATFSGATKMEAWDAYSRAGDALGRPVLKDADLSMTNEYAPDKDE
jgi:hypothetical protein